MPIKRYKAEQIVTILRQIEVGIANGKLTPQACKEAEITVQTFYRWRKEYGGLKMDQAKRLKELEKENGKLKRLVAETIGQHHQKCVGEIGRRALTVALKFAYALGNCAARQTLDNRRSRHCQGVNLTNRVVTILR